MVERYMRGGVQIRKTEAGRILSHAYGMGQERCLRDFEKRAHTVFRMNRSLRSYTDTATGISLVKY